ncbi:tubulin-specific chaperone a [Plasmodium brasilianum]|uniref:Tubulin-specific chaperone A n=2 Tax=Plasmodium (Plasmodium) TaxID=418103 RepID=A0A1A8X775_PLAMA|nr:tubulin-specific chaperone a, putative [Plasmodium malariae]KAI4840906.1 tubulin-specific chaperone a [Plasmodium brasilianum]SBT00462.1 tubulin-specific chaperone a [Plasmodium malariae]SBT87101.1 tubulin-specific chaperone a, putative [Plasmodium malariae]
MENLPAHFRLLKINHGAVRRLFKELNYYEKEERELRSKVDKLKNENRNECEIIRSEEILQETVRVLPHISNSLQKSLQKLCEIIYEHFLNILEIKDNKIEICKACSENELKEILMTQYDDFCKEIEDINQILEKIFIHIKDASLPVCPSVVKSNLVLPKEECVDI